MEEKKKPSKKKKPTIRNFLQVGKAKIEDKNSKELRALRYSDIPADQDCWVIDAQYRPISFDMTLLKIRNRNKHVPGWWDGMEWTGLHFRPEFIVIAWKRYGVYE